MAMGQNPADILENVRLANKLICEAMKGAAIDETTRTAAIFGIKVRVISWICVSACNKAIKVPTNMAVITMGAHTFNNVWNENWISSRASTSFIWRHPEFHSMITPLVIGRLEPPTRFATRPASVNSTEAIIPVNSPSEDVAVRPIISVACPSRFD